MPRPPPKPPIVDDDTGIGPFVLLGALTLIWIAGAVLHFLGRAC